MQDIIENILLIRNVQRYMRGWTGGGEAPYLPSRPLLPSGAARASRALNFPLFPSLPFSFPSPSSRPLFSLLPPPLLPPPTPSSPPPSYPVLPLIYVFSLVF